MIAFWPPVCWVTLRQFWGAAWLRRCPEHGIWGLDVENVPVDERYPSIYQRGGGGHAQPEQVNASVVSHVAPAAVPVVTPIAATPADMPAADNAGGVDDGGAPKLAVTSAAAATRVSGNRWPARYPFALAGLTLAILAVGVFFLTAQYWIPSSMVASAPDRIRVQPWGLTLFYVAPAILTAGTGMMCGLLLVASRQWLRGEYWLRLAMWALATVLITAGIWTLFAQNLFPLDLMNYPQGDGPVAQPMVWLLTILSNVLLVPGLAAVAALLVLPPVRPRTAWAPQPAFEAGNAPDFVAGAGNETPLRGTPSARSAWIAGGVFAAVGIVNLFAGQLFPYSMEAQTITDGQSSVELQPWPFLLAGSAPAFLLIGFGAVAWGAFVWALAGVRKSAGARNQETGGAGD